jgi:hypothetical protein
MSNLVKYFLLLSLSCILVFHFVFILIYASPIKSNNSKLSGYSQKYVYPLFHQSWGLFVPSPINKNYILVKTQNNSEWKILFPINLTSLSKAPFIGSDAISLLFSNALIYELNVLPNKSTIFNSKPTNQEFEILNHEIRAYLKQHNKIDDTSKYEITLLSDAYKGQLVYQFKNLHSTK